MPCSKRMRACHPRCAHRESVYDYRAERERQVSDAIDGPGWRTRDGDHDAPKLIDFKGWLRGRRR